MSGTIDSFTGRVLMMKRMLLIIPGTLRITTKNDQALRQNASDGVMNAPPRLWKASDQERNDPVLPVMSEMKRGMLLMPHGTLEIGFWNDRAPGEKASDETMNRFVLFQKVSNHGQDHPVLHRNASNEPMNVLHLPQNDSNRVLEPLGSS